MEKSVEASSQKEFVSPVSRAAISLRVSVTDRCQNRCLYCTPPEGVEIFTHNDILRYEEILRLVRVLRDRRGLSKVHLTGGEPLLRRGLAGLVRMLTEAGVEDIALTTNGLAMAESAGELKRAGLRRVNISLDSLSAETYEKITRNTVDGPDKIVAGIEAAMAAGLSVKLNAIMLRSLNDAESAGLVRFALRRSLTLRFIELMPFGPAAEMHEQWFVPACETLERIGSDAVLNCKKLSPVDRQPGSSSRLFAVQTADGLTGHLGVISSNTHPFCYDCNRLRLSACGELIGCLARSDERLNIRHLLQTDRVDPDAIMRAVEKVLLHKRTDRNFDNSQNMVQIGG